MASSYVLNPTPQGGQGAFGAVPGQLGLPTSIYDQLKSNVPNYGALTSSATGDIGSELAGRLSPGTTNLLQDKAAAMGINLGQPGGQPGNTITNQNFLNSLGLTSEGLAHQGVTDYNTFTGTAGSQQLAPELQSEIALQNAVDAAAPNPASAQSYAQSLFDKYLKEQSNPAGGTKKIQNATYRTDPQGRFMGGSAQAFQEYG
jgi:hypothetical protein